MFVEMSDLEGLLELQRYDLELMRTRKKRAELPQRLKIAEARQKKQVLAEKAAAISALKEKKDSEMEKVATEDSKLVDKQRKAQELIDSAGTDYRSIEAHSRELSGIAKRRETLSGKIETLTSELAQINELAARISQAQETLEKGEASYLAEYRAADSELASVEREALDKREELAAQLPGDLVKLYETTATKTNGVAIGELEDNRCGVCHSTIEGGRLIELKAQAPLGTCPSCKRLLIVK